MHNLFVITTGDSEDPDEVPHNTAFHQGLHYLLRQKLSSEKKLHYHLEIVTCGPSHYAFFPLLNNIKDIICGNVRKCVMLSIIFWTIYL